MRNLCRLQKIRFCFRFLPLWMATVLAILAPANASGNLPFDLEKICRLSIDNIPRSIAVRQGGDVWFGYDLEKAMVFKVWRAPKDRPGVNFKGFKAFSKGTTWYDEKGTEGWQLKSAEGGNATLSIRYLGCTQHKGHFELRWELGHPKGTIELRERIPITPATASGRAYRELRAEALAPGAVLLLPPAYREGWLLTGPEGKTQTSLAHPGWHRLSLP